MGLILLVPDTFQRFMVMALGHGHPLGLNLGLLWILFFRKDQGSQDEIEYGPLDFLEKQNLVIS